MRLHSAQTLKSIIYKSKANIIISVSNIPKIYKRFLEDGSNNTQTASLNCRSIAPVWRFEEELHLSLVTSAANNFWKSVNCKGKGNG